MYPNRTLLLAVTGMSPAVITETLFGIDRNGEEWPKEIKVITTAVGKEKVSKGLIFDKHLEKLCIELRKPIIAFTEQHILVVPNANGMPVEDARSLDDHEALANFIMTTVRDATADEDTKIHASIAGGRKTMTFYLGYAMSLFGRHFDRLSHVLVSEGFEQCPDFFYPTREDSKVYSFSKQVLNAKDAEITLADIPFIRQRSLVPDLIKKVQNQINFRQLIDLINLGDQPEAIELHVYPSAQYLELKNRRNKNRLATVEFKNLLHWCLYLLLLEDTVREIDEREEFTAPKKSESDNSFGLTLLLKLSEICGVEAKGDNFEQVATYLYEQSDRFDNAAGLKRSLLSLSEKGFQSNHFSTYLNTIKTTLETELSINLAGHITPKQVDQTLSEDDITDTKVKRDSDRLKKGEMISRRKTKTGKKGGQHYIVHLPNPNKQIIFH